MSIDQTEALPPLPKPFYTIAWSEENGMYSAGQMRDYARAAISTAPTTGHGGISSCGCSWAEMWHEGKFVRTEHRCKAHRPPSQRPALVTALQGLLASLSREPTEFELRAAAHEFTVMADRAAAADRAGADSDA